jgi:toxin-antitoxin system PIN domain toxin
MHCVDVNVLVDSVVTTSPQHVNARNSVDRLRRSPSGLGLFSTVVSGFIRISTNRRVLKEPLNLSAALGVIDALTASPFVQIINPGPAHWAIFRRLLDEHRPITHDVTDVWLAAAAMEINATWVSFDRGFARFNDLRWVNPGNPT